MNTKIKELHEKYNTIFFNKNLKTWLVKAGNIYNWTNKNLNNKKPIILECIKHAQKKTIEVVKIKEEKEIKIECKEAKQIEEGLNTGTITKITERQIIDKKKPNET